MNKQATITVANSHTQNLMELAKASKVIICGAGSPNIITKEMVSADYIIMPNQILAKAGIHIQQLSPRKYFIKGFLNSPNCCVFDKDDCNIVVILSKSYHITRTISDITGGELMTKNLEYCCVFKDYDKFYNSIFFRFANCR